MFHSERGSMCPWKPYVAVTRGGRGGQMEGEEVPTVWPLLCPLEVFSQPEWATLPALLVWHRHRGPHRAFSRGGVEALLPVFASSMQFAIALTALRFVW